MQNGDAPLKIEGVDVETGLRRLLGKRELYEELLHKFVIGAEAQSVETIREQLKVGQRDDAERAAHSLKGVAGALGAIELQAEAAEVEAALGRPDVDVEVLLPALAAEIERVVAAIVAALPAESSAEESVIDAEIDWDRARQVIADLEGLLEENDSSALDIFDEWSSLLQGVLGDDYATAKAALSGWDFAAAQAILESAKDAEPRLLAEQAV